MFAPGIALGHVIGRFGCLLAGCCYGLPTELPWSITFTDPFASSPLLVTGARALELVVEAAQQEATDIHHNV